MKALEASWYKQKLTLLGVAFLPLSGLFWLLSSIRRLAFKLGLIKSFKAHVPLIVVGNIGIGGNGKTPFVLWLVPYLQNRGLKVGVISRGYGSKAKSYPYLVNENSSVEESGDEPYLLFSRLQCPLVIGADRQASCEYLQTHFDLDVIISDDGLQHYKMQRDIELCIVDSQRRFGNGFLLPVGPLRELPSRLKSVDMVIENGADEGVAYQLNHSGIYSVKGNLKVNDYPIEGHAVSAIGSPSRFEKSLENEGINLQGRHHFRDHHQYQQSDFSTMGEAAVFMTEKDAVKCTHFAKANWYYLKVDACPTTKLHDEIDNILKSKGL